MSREDYQIGKEIEMHYDSDDFYGVLQGLFRLADTDNLERLRHEFPNVWNELQMRYHAPGGILPGDSE